jgi:CheY-like chemotaxis protein
LVVDDNEDGAEMLAVFLNLSGHTTRMAHCGREALALVEEFEPHVVFLDIGLPDMSGYDVARALRSRSSAPQPRLVAVTGWGTEEDRRRAQHAGFDDHLVKPVDTKRVSLLLEQEGEKP